VLHDRSPRCLDHPSECVTSRFGPFCAKQSCVERSYRACFLLLTLIFLFRTPRGDMIVARSPCAVPKVWATFRSHASSCVRYRSTFQSPALSSRQILLWSLQHFQRACCLNSTAPLSERHYAFRAGIVMELGPSVRQLKLLVRILQHFKPILVLRLNSAAGCDQK
jgi:hypothetical protein